MKPSAIIRKFDWVETTCFRSFEDTFSIFVPNKILLIFVEKSKILEFHRGLRLTYFCTILKESFCVEAKKTNSSVAIFLTDLKREEHGCCGWKMHRWSHVLYCCLFVIVFSRKSRSEHGEIIPAGAKYQNKVHPHHALALVWTHLHASRVLWMLCRLVKSNVFKKMYCVQEIKTVSTL